LVTGDQWVGGLVGVNDGSSLIFSSFWDTETSGQPTSAGGTGKTTLQMKTLSTFTNAGWDFTDTDGDPADWRMEPHAYPALAWEPVVIRYSGGDGEPNSPYKIANVADFQLLSATPTDWSLSFILTADINLTSLTFTQAPIAPDTNNTPDNGFQGTKFTGVFDGNGHTISNLTITASTKEFIGLFGYVGSGSQICNLGVENVNMTGRRVVGRLVGANGYGTLTTCYATGSVSGTYRIGGLVGVNIVGTITTCYATGSVSGTQGVGGLVGDNSSGSLTSCYAAGSVSGDSYVGGLVGFNYQGKVIRCYSTGKPSGTSNIGGLCGYITTGGGYEDTGNFWDTQTSQRATSVMGTGKTTTEMKTLLTFTSAGWDFVGETANGPNDIWKICNGTNYPKLAWQKPLSGDFVCPDGVEIYDLAALSDQWLVEEIPADLAPSAGNGIVNFADFAVFAGQWCVSKDIYALNDFAEQWLKVGLRRCSADISPLPDGDGVVNMLDFAMFAENWLRGQ
jgi:hypothetical protein